MATERDNGGPAFPGTLYGQHKSVSYAGMTLRDWFAGQALAGLNVGNAAAETCTPDSIVAEIAYRIADAMLAERSK